MALHVEHELHRRRFSRNAGLGATLVALVFIVFGLTVAKVTEGDPARAIDGAGFIGTDAG